MTLPNLPDVDASYLQQLVSVLEQSLHERLVGVYLFGSAGAGHYEPGISDLDVQAVVEAPLNAHERVALAMRLAHAELPCPARRLEFVCYDRAAVEAAHRHPRFQLNFNTGAGGLHHLSTDPSAEASHWFLLDIALGRERGRTLHGEPLEQVFGAVPRKWVLEAMEDSLVWHEESEPASANAVLNACRAWRYAVTGQLGSKGEAVEWARGKNPVAAVVEAAWGCRHGGPPVQPEAASAFIASVRGALAAAKQ